MQRDQRTFHVRFHLPAVAADEDHRALFDQVPDCIAFGQHEILHIGFWSIAARESDLQSSDAIAIEGLQLFGVEKIVVRPATAEEQ